MKCDCAFRIGKSHEICQDYAYASKDFPYIILSDGCSTSQRTDYGARILVSSAEQSLRFGNHVNNLSFFCSTASIAGQHQHNLSLPLESLDCTLLIAVLRSTQKLEVSIMGDGVVVFKHKNGEIVVYSIEYDTGYPSYLSYLIDHNRLNVWEKKMLDYGGLRESISINIYYRDEKLQWHTYLNNDPFGSQSVRMNNFISSIGVCSHQFHPIVSPFNEKDIEFVALMSDGIRSFAKVTQEETGTKNNPLHLTEVLDKLLDFKGFNGVFAHRRLNKFLKDMGKENCEHFDDISLAVMSSVE